MWQQYGLQWREIDVYWRVFYFLLHFMCKEFFKFFSNSNRSSYLEGIWEKVLCNRWIKEGVRSNLKALVLKMGSSWDFLHKIRVRDKNVRSLSYHGGFILVSLPYFFIVSLTVSVNVSFSQNQIEDCFVFLKKCIVFASKKNTTSGNCVALHFFRKERHEEKKFKKQDLAFSFLLFFDQRICCEKSYV